MSALVAWLLTNPTILGMGAAIIAALGFGVQQRLAGAKAERSKRDAADAAAGTEGQKIDDAVAGRSPDENRERLAKWSKS